MNKLQHIACLLLLIPFSGNGQDILFTEQFSSGIPASWSLVNEDELIPAAAVSEFTQAWIPYIYESDTCAASTSYYDPSGQAADYLITPKISLGNFSSVNWTARSVDASYPDGYLILLSSTDSLIASFTDTLMTVSGEGNYFTTRGVQLDLAGYANQDIYIAFKNNTENGFILLFDQVTVYGAETVVLTSVEQDFNITVFPNPTLDILTIKSAEAIDRIALYNLQGEVIMETASTSLSMGDLPVGNYILLVSTNTGTFRKMVAKGA